MDTTERDAQDRADMQRLASGQDGALNDLMERHAQAIFQFLYRMLGNEEDANDVAQESFVRVFKHRANFKPDARFGTWLYTIAGNLARNHHRWRVRHPNVSLDAPPVGGEQTLGEMLPSSVASPDANATKTERLQAVRAAVDKLPPDMRAAIILCEWEELSLNAAAQALNTTAKAVESRLYRARKLLRESLAAWI